MAYLNDNELLYEIILSKGKGQLTRKAIDMFILIANNAINMMSYKSSDLKQDCIQAGILVLLIKWRGFDETKFDKPLNYYTELFKRAIAEEFNLHQGIKPHYSRYNNGENINIIPIAACATNF